jgi:large subunit ribosomal protein L22
MSKAILRGIRLSPKKSRLIARQVQGMNGEYALASLEFTPNKAAKVIYKVLASAIANGDFQPEEVTVTSVRVDEGPVLKRFRPRARGSASKIRKPTAHVLVVVDKAEAKVENVAKKTPVKAESKSKEPVKSKVSATKTITKPKTVAKAKTVEKAESKPKTVAKTATKAKIAKEKSTKEEQ